MTKLILDGDSRGAVKAQADVAKAQEKVTKEVDQSILRVDELRRRQKQALAEIAAELKKEQAAKEKSNQTTQRAIQFWHEHGRIVAQTLGKQRSGLEQVKTAQELAFGAGAMQSMTNFFTSFFAPGAIVGGAIAMLREYRAELEGIGQELRGGRAGLGQLSQLAITSDDPNATMKRLVGEAKQIHASGATSTLGEAGELVFTLESAGIKAPKQRKMISDMLAYGVIPEARNFSASIAALRSAFPNLSPDQLTGMGIVAAIPSPGGAEQIIQHAGKSAEQARALGWNPEFALAGTSILSRAYGGASEGGVRLEQFMKQVEHYGFKHDPGLKGLDPFQTIERIQAITGGERSKLEKYVGNRMEALQGFRTLRNNLAELRTLTGMAASADSSVATGAIELARNTPEIDVARQAIASENARKQSRLPQVTTDELIAALANEAKAGRGGLMSGLIGSDFAVLRTIGTESQKRRVLRESIDGRVEPLGVGYGFSPSNELIEAIKRNELHLRSLDRKTRGTPPPSGRQE
jgi:hypothetical protein